MKNEKVYTAKDMMKDIKKAQFKAKMKKTWNGVKSWVICNKEIVVALAPVVIGLLTITVKTVGKSINTTKAKNVKELYCYDPALGHYWELRRKLMSKFIEGFHQKMKSLDKSFLSLYPIK